MVALLVSKVKINTMQNSTTLYIVWDAPSFIVLKLKETLFTIVGIDFISSDILIFCD